MAFKLSRSEKKQKDALVAKLRDLESSLTEKVDELTARLAQEIENVNIVIREYNDVVQEAESWIEGVYSTWQDAHDEKSEGWQEGERGQAVSQLIGEWEFAEVDTIDEIGLIEPEVDNLGAADALDALPEEADL